MFPPKIETNSKTKSITTNIITAFLAQLFPERRHTAIRKPKTATPANIADMMPPKMAAVPIMGLIIMSPIIVEKTPNTMAAITPPIPPSMYNIARIVIPRGRCMYGKNRQN